MVYTLTSVIAFCLTLFVYIHIKHHRKRSNDLDVYYIDYPSKEKLDEVCEMRQPVVFTAAKLADVIKTSFDMDTLVQKYGEFNVNIRLKEALTPVRLRDAYSMCSQSSTLLSELNNDFVVETGLAKNLKTIEYMLRPSMVVMVKYDMLFGGKGSHTPLRMRINYKNYLTVVKGNVSVRLASSKYARELGLEHDYDAFDFLAKNDDVYNAKFLKVELKPFQSLFVPPHWFYSVEFESSDAVVVGMYYETAMSVMANAEDYIMQHLQSHNIRYKLPTYISGAYISDGSLNDISDNISMEVKVHQENKVFLDEPIFTKLDQKSEETPHEEIVSDDNKNGKTELQ